MADSVTHITQHLQYQALHSISVAKVCNPSSNNYFPYLSIFKNIKFKIFFHIFSKSVV